MNSVAEGAAYLLALRRQRQGKPAEQVERLFRAAGDDAGDDARLRDLARQALSPARQDHAPAR